MLTFHTCQQGQIPHPYKPFFGTHGPNAVSSPAHTSQKSRTVYQQLAITVKNCHYFVTILLHRKYSRKSIFVTNIFHCHIMTEKVLMI